MCEIHSYRCKRPGCGNRWREYRKLASCDADDRTSSKACCDEQYCMFAGRPDRPKLSECKTCRRQRELQNPGAGNDSGDDNYVPPPDGTIICEIPPLPFDAHGNPVLTSTTQSGNTASDPCVSQHSAFRAGAVAPSSDSLLQDHSHISSCRIAQVNIATVTPDQLDDQARRALDEMRRKRTKENQRLAAARASVHGNAKSDGVGTVMAAASHKQGSMPTVQVMAGYPGLITPPSMTAGDYGGQSAVGNIGIGMATCEPAEWAAHMMPPIPHGTGVFGPQQPVDPLTGMSFGLTAGFDIAAGFSGYQQPMTHHSAPHSVGRPLPLSSQRANASGNAPGKPAVLAPAKKGARISKSQQAQNNVKAAALDYALVNGGQQISAGFHLGPKMGGSIMDEMSMRSMQPTPTTPVTMRGTPSDALGIGCTQPTFPPLAATGGKPIDTKQKNVENGTPVFRPPTRGSNHYLDSPRNIRPEARLFTAPASTPTSHTPSMAVSPNTQSVSSQPYSALEQIISQQQNGAQQTQQFNNWVSPFLDSSLNLSGFPAHLSMRTTTLGQPAPNVFAVSAYSMATEPQLMSQPLGPESRFSPLIDPMLGSTGNSTTYLEPFGTMSVEATQIPSSATNEVQTSIGMFRMPQWQSQNQTQSFNFRSTGLASPAVSPHTIIPQPHTGTTPSPFQQHLHMAVSRAQTLPVQTTTAASATPDAERTTPRRNRVAKSSTGKTMQQSGSSRRRTTAKTPRATRASFANVANAAMTVATTRTPDSKTMMSTGTQNILATNGPLMVDFLASPSTTAPVQDFDMVSIQPPGHISDEDTAQRHAPASHIGPGSAIVRSEEIDGLSNADDIEVLWAKLLTEYLATDQTVEVDMSKYVLPMEFISEYHTPDTVRNVEL